MKHCFFSLLFLFVSWTNLWSQHRELSQVIDIPGVFRKDYEEVKKGTPFVLRNVVELKRAPRMGDIRKQAVLIVDGFQFGLPIDQLDVVELLPNNKDAFWQTCQLNNDLITFYDKKGYQQSLRKELAQDADEYLRELGKNRMFYEDAAVEDYLQCLLLEIIPDKMAVFRNEVPQVRLLKSPSPDLLLLGNNCLLVSTGLLTTLNTEEELYALLTHEVAHYVLDHAIITINKNMARVRRAEFWGAVMDGVTEALEETLYMRSDYYVPGLIFATNDLVQALINQRIMNRMGLDYSADQEEYADRVTFEFLDLMGKQRVSLINALSKVKNYYVRTKDVEALGTYGVQGTLTQRLKKMGQPALLPVDRIYLKKTMGVVGFEAAMQDFNRNYRESGRLARKNIDNQLAGVNDYLMLARSTMRLQSTRESNEACWKWLDKAESLSSEPNINTCKMKILLLLRENRQKDAVEWLQQYQDILGKLFQQPHTEDDARWMTEEHTWSNNLLERIRKL